MLYKPGKFKKNDQTVVDLKALAARTITINGTTFKLGYELAGKRL